MRGDVVGVGLLVVEACVMWMDGVVDGVSEIVLEGCGISTRRKAMVEL